MSGRSCHDGVGADGGVVNAWLFFVKVASRPGIRSGRAGHAGLGRSPNPHLAFSAGAHFCLGAPLARLHGEVATRVLLERLPQVQLAGKPEWLGSIPLRVLPVPGLA